MNQIFLVLAVVDATLLLISYGLGWFVPSGAGGLVHDLHFLVALLTVVATLMVHGIVYTYFIGTNKWVKEVARVYALPEWVEAQSKRNKRRAMPLVTWGMLAIGATAWLGAAADTIRGFGGTWHLVAATFTLAFTFGAFALEYLAIVGQMRLLVEVKAQADRLRLERLAATGANDPALAATPADPA
jgi:hypothetical protein